MNTHQSRAKCSPSCGDGELAEPHSRAEVSLMKFGDTQIGRDHCGSKVVSNPGAKGQRLAVSLARGLEVAESLLARSVCSVSKRQAGWVLAGIPGLYSGLQTACSCRKLKEEEIAIRLRIGEHRRNFARELRYRDLRLFSRSSYPTLVPRIGTRSGAFKQCVPDQLGIP